MREKHYKQNETGPYNECRLNDRALTIALRMEDMVNETKEILRTTALKCDTETYDRVHDAYLSLLVAQKLYMHLTFRGIVGGEGIE